MKILILSFYYSPDLSAGSFRTSALVEELQLKLGVNDEIDIVTTMPNRYQKYRQDTLQYEKDGNVNIYRIKLSNHKSGFVDQSISYLFYAYNTIKYAKNKEYDLIYATSGRLFTGLLGAILSRSKKVPLYLDIRDIFVDTMKSILPSYTRYIFIPFFSLVEKFTFRSASKINIVSEGFRNYFKKIVPDMNLSFFTNGIDDEFFGNFYSDTNQVNEKIIITYAGNIGKGQGLECIIPKISPFLGDEYEIRIIGDGGSREALVKELDIIGAKNTVLIDPVSRDKLLNYYAESDFLFLHLNDVSAFEKVLPSKIFEYAVTGKPILAGIKGYSRKFIKENVSGVMLFDPCDGNDFSNKFSSFKYESVERIDFCKKYSRKTIMNKMADDILSTKLL